MGIEEYKYMYPEIWDEADRDKTKFIRLLYTYKIINLDEWDELFKSITSPVYTTTPEETKTQTYRQQIGALLWDRQSQFFSMMWDNVWPAFLEIIVPIVEKIYNFIDGTLGGLLNYYIKSMRSLTTIKSDDPPMIKEAMTEFYASPSLMGFIWIWVYRVGYWIGFATSVIPIVGKDAVRKLNKEYSPALPDISALVSYYYKVPGDRDLVYAKAAEQGFERSEVDVYIRSMEALFSVDDLRQMFLRGIVDDETLVAQLNRAGWDNDSINKLKQIFYVIPGPSEQIRFAVREAFDDEYIKHFDTMKDFPEGFANEAKKVGVDRYWAEKFWAAHWELPPLAAAYEMLHRDVIESSDLDELFKAQDIMPWWRDKLQEISYNPLTRVDVRRMYKTGTLDRDGVKRAYLDVGYNEKNAELMTDFTIKWASESERDLTKADILGAYQRKLISLEDTRSGLTSLGYDSDEADILISRIDYEVAKKKKSAVLKNLQKGYKKGIYDTNHIQRRMQELNMSGAEITELIGLWEVETKDDTASLNKSDFDALFKKKVIDEKTYRAELGKLKYIERDIGWMVKLHG